MSRKAKHSSAPEKVDEIVEKMDRAASLRRMLASGLAERLRHALSGRNISLLARDLKVSRTAIYNWRTGQAVPDLVTLARLASRIGYSAGWLATGEGPQKPGAPVSGNYVFPNFLPAAAAAEPPLAFQNDYLTGVYLRSGVGIAGHAVDLFLIQMPDDSMEPTVRRQDVLIVDPKRPLAGGNRIVALAVTMDRFFVRRVSFGAHKGATLICDNPAYEPERLSAEDLSSNYAGTVIWRGGLI